MKKLIFLLGVFVVSCSSDNDNNTINNPNTIVDFDFSEILDINFNDLPNYSNQPIPNYITKDNSNGNNITDEIAVLGRVLFYDKNLSTNGTISCSSCHKQEFAFSDNINVSNGVNGTTGRHSMRLVNSRFANEQKFFWDERANTLEQQTTMPIKDHIEMGFSGENGDLSFDNLIQNLENTEYYPPLFEFAFGNSEISEAKIQIALAQFVRSIQSFDSKYDLGRSQAPNDGAPFLNFTPQENNGKQLFLLPPVFNNQGIRIDGGLGCAGCHQAPEFDIDPNSLNNGVIGNANGTGTDLIVTRSPSLRDVIKSDGTSNGPFMHIGVSNNFMTVLTHYNEINVAGNNNLDPRLMPGGNPQQLNLTQQERNDVFEFMKTLAGNNIYTDPKWSNPFLD
ncbi:cytochrome-c peroxidase [Hanstruepera neustonica]|uniref:Cytochrome-c peroxidase n=1 Tax=Hanstruepera neustonica TaxID=1445657 RepID=A0A2K1DXJ0_9FLAO|nr:cytochrome-c peroxidase [Hanstruepera neustonica]PNQ72735.1 cytochrome-c peroxidase [Hanstruepera neustonica]